MTRQILNPVFAVDGRTLSDRTTVRCEFPGCSTSVAIGDSYSVVVCWATTGPGANVPAFQCPEEQHFCCSREHAMAAANNCMHEHLLPELQRRWEEVKPV